MAVESIYGLAYQSSNPEPGRPTILDVIRHEILTTFPPPSPFDKRISQRLYNLDAFLKEFRDHEKKGSWVDLSIVYLPQDHTSGTQPGMPTRLRT